MAGRHEKVMIGEAGIELRELAFGYAETRVSFDALFPAKSIMAITGPSGSGKTTLLNLIAGFEVPESGSIHIFGKSMAGLQPSERPVSFLFQEHNLFSHLSVHDNVALGISPSLKITTDGEAKILASLARLGMEDKLKRLPEELSGGERQRAALARVLVQDRPIVLLDEPFASLGPSLRQDMTKLVGELQAERQMTILIVTHHPAEMAGIASNLCFVDEGTIKALGPLKELLGRGAPASLRAYLGEAGQIS
jgi:thiamine transport system ATP-binding protein